MRAYSQRPKRLITMFLLILFWLIHTMLSVHVRMFYKVRGCIQYWVCSVFHEDPCRIRGLFTLLVSPYTLFCDGNVPCVLYMLLWSEVEHDIIYIIVIWNKEQNPTYIYVGHVIRQMVLAYSTLSLPQSLETIKRNSVFWMDFIMCYYRVHVFSYLSYNIHECIFHVWAVMI